MHDPTFAPVSGQVDWDAEAEAWADESLAIAEVTIGAGGDPDA